MAVHFLARHKPISRILFWKFIKSAQMVVTFSSRQVCGSNGKVNPER